MTTLCSNINTNPVATADKLEFPNRLYVLFPIKNISSVYIAASENPALDLCCCWYLNRMPSVYCLHILFLDWTARPQIYYRKKVSHI